jgi:hypothetical protein
MTGIRHGVAFAALGACHRCGDLDFVVEMLAVGAGPFVADFSAAKQVVIIY